MTVFKSVASSVTLAAGLLLSNTASAAIPLDLTRVKADSIFSLTLAAMAQIEQINATIGVGDSGNNNATLLGTEEMVSPETGIAYAVPKFNLPANKSDVTILKGGELINVLNGEAMGSALVITRPGGRQPDRKVAFANFFIDFTNELMYADVFMSAYTDSTGTVLENITMPLQALYRFTDNDDLKLKFQLRGTNLIMTASLGAMYMQDAAAEMMLRGLGYNPQSLIPAVLAVDWGSVKIDANMLEKRPGGRLDATPVTPEELGLWGTPPAVAATTPVELQSKNKNKK